MHPGGGLSANDHGGTRNRARAGPQLFPPTATKMKLFLAYVATTNLFISAWAAAHDCWLAASVAGAACLLCVLMTVVLICFDKRK